MATDKEVKIEDQGSYDEPTQADKDLTAFVVDHCDRWRDYRNTNFLPYWLEYERIFRGEWAVEDKSRESERSRIVTPATQQAVETRHAEIMEAIFGQGEFFDIEDDIRDYNGNPIDVEIIKAQLMEDFKKDKIRKSIDQIELMAEIYGTGIGEIVVKTEKEYVPATQAIPNMQGQAAIGVMEKDRIGVKIMPVNPKNFLFDPNGTSIDDCMGVAIEKYISIHDPTDKKLANSWNGKNFFDDQAAGENAGGERAGISDEGKNSRAECVEKDECLFGDSFGTAGTDEVGPDRFQETGSG